MTASIRASLEVSLVPPFRDSTGVASRGIERETDFRNGSEETTWLGSTGEGGELAALFWIDGEEVGWTSLDLLGALNQDPIIDGLDLGRRGMLNGRLALYVV